MILYANFFFSLAPHSRMVNKARSTRMVFVTSCISTRHHIPHESNEKQSTSKNQMWFELQTATKNKWLFFYFLRCIHIYLFQVVHWKLDNRQRADRNKWITYTTINGSLTFPLSFRAAQKHIHTGEHTLILELIIRISLHLSDVDVETWFLSRDL